MTAPAPGADDQDAARRQRLARVLLAWGEERRRDLPWRRTRDGWAVLVSEVMLQQTQVARVRRHFPPFLDDYPTPAACAGAPRGEIIRAWDGLGFNRRAVALHRAAERIVDRHDGRVPDDLDDLLALPGVGDYTARAVLAFAFERDVGVVDTNAARVLARAVAGHRLTRSQAQRLADAMVPEGAGWAYNQSVLDFAAAVCTKRSPACGDCSARPACAWARAGLPEPDPVAATAGTSGRQSTFEGSDRQGRGRLVRALRTGAVPVHRLADAAGWPGDPDRARRVADGLVADGLAEYADGTLVLPGPVS